MKSDEVGSVIGSLIKEPGLNLHFCQYFGSPICLEPVRFSRANLGPSNAPTYFFFDSDTQFRAALEVSKCRA